MRPDASGRRAPTATASTSPPPPIAAIRTISSGSAPSISTTCCCSPKSCSTSFPPSARAEAERFDHVLIDEYQDTNRSQYQIVKALAGGHRNLCVVGDDDQSIYGWRGAEVTHILRFQQDWPEAKIVRLEDNYRSTAAILELRQHADRVQSPAARKGAAAPPSRAATRPGICSARTKRRRPSASSATSADCVDARDAQPRDIAILCRTNEQPRSFETELRRANVPYVLIGGMSFFDRKEVRDILAYLKVIDNPHDEPSLLRIINQPPRGIGNAAQKRLLDEADVARQVPVGRAARCARGRRRRRQNGRRRRPISPADRRVSQPARQDQPSRSSSQQVLDKTDYRDALVKLYPDPAEREARLASLEEIVNAAASYEKNRRSRIDASAVRLPRRHAAQRARRQRRKGIAARPQRGRADDAAQREGPGVSARLPGRHGRRHPAAQAVARSRERRGDRRRAAAVLRRRHAGPEQLTLSFALTRRKWGKPRTTIPSRFLYEMTGQAENFPPAAEGRTRRSQEANSSRRQDASRNAARTLALRHASTRCSVAS